MEDKYPAIGDMEFDMANGGVSRIYTGDQWVSVSHLWDPTQTTKTASGSGSGSVTFKKQTQFDNHHNKHYPNPSMSSQTMSSAASAYYGDNPLTYTAFERLFWDTLVDLGWKAFDVKEDGKIEQIMLTCSDCGKSIGKTQMVHTITKSKAHKISSPTQIQDMVREHKKTNKGCNKPEYDENGDPI